MTPSSPTKIDPDTITFTHDEAANLSVKDIAERRQNPTGLPLYIEGLDKHMPPFRGSDLVTVCGRPGHGKTSFMLRWARARDEDLAARQLKRAIVICTWETSVEQAVNYFIAAHTGVSIGQLARAELSDEEFKLVDGYKVAHAGRNIWFVGHSVTSQKRRPPMNMPAVYEALDAIRNWDGTNSNELDCVFLDYLQRIKPSRQRDNQVVEYSSTVDECKDGALMFHCPFVLGAQAKQTIDDRNDPIPTDRDVEWTNNAQESSDGMLGLLRPAKYPEKIQDGSIYHDITVKQDYLAKLLLVRLNKHKAAAAPYDHWCFFDVATNVMLKQNPFTKANINP
jgi:replicative DNA helicase